MEFNHAALLYHLQVIDLGITKQKTRLKEINTLLNNNEAVAAAAARLTAAEGHIKPLETRARELELESKGLSAKIQESESNLYAGKIKNPKALEELQVEAESLKRRFSHLDELLLDVMMKIEDQATAIEALRVEHQQAVESQGDKVVDLLKDKTQLEGEIAAAVEKRKATAAKIDPTFVTTYEGLRQQMRGTPVAQLNEDSCTVCGVEQTSMLSQKVRQGRQIIYCASCGRILAAL